MYIIMLNQRHQHCLGQTWAYSFDKNWIEYLALDESCKTMIVIISISSEKGYYFFYCYHSPTKFLSPARSLLVLIKTLISPLR